MFVLEEKIYFWLLLVIPVVVVLYLLTSIWKKRAQRKFAEKSLLNKLTPNKSVFKPLLKVILFCLALACFVIALVNPKIGSKMETIKREGIDIVFAMDVSKSMLAEDIAPNRMEKSKQLVTQILNNLTSDRVGIIAYAGSAFPQLPITTDYGAAKLFLQALNTNMVSSQGTAITDAIELSKSYFDEADKTSRVLIIVSDGEDHGGGIEAVSQEAAEEGIKIITIGVGTERGGPIPLKEKGIVKSYKKDRQGETVITKMDPSTLKEIAKATGGEYINGTNTDEVVSKVTDLLNNIEKTEFETKQYADYKDQFQWFIGFGILFMVLEVLLLERKTAWINRLNLFNEKKKEGENE